MRPSLTPAKRLHVVRAYSAVSVRASSELAQPGLECLLCLSVPLRFGS